MKKNILALTIILMGLVAQAQPESENYCSYGGSTSGVVKFTNVNSRFEARLSEKLIVTYTKRFTFGFVSHLILANYNNGQVIISDSFKDNYGDFQPLRNLIISASIEGKTLFCFFNPQSI